MVKEIELKYYVKTFIEERGYLYVINLKSNNFPTKKEEIYKFFYEHIFLIEDSKYKTYSIEFTEDLCEYCYITVSFKKINNC